MSTPQIPIVRVSRSGRERMIGMASTMESAERLAAQLAALKPHLVTYVDCARTVDELQASQDSLGFIA